MKTYKFIKLLALGVALSTAACSSDEGIDSGVDEGKTFQDITASEASAVCEATLDYFFTKVSKSEFCKLSGMAAYAAALSGPLDPIDTCNEAVADCMNDSDLTCDEDDANVESCSNTVGEVEACSVASTDALEAAFEDLELPGCDGMEAFVADEAKVEKLKTAATIDVDGLDACKSLDPGCLED